MQTEILVSLGPSTDSYEVVRDLVAAGMTIARINFSHATLEEAEKRIEMVRKANEELGKDVKIFQDLCGPRIRVGRVETNGEDGRDIAEGEEVTFYTTGAPDPQANEIEIRDPYMHNDVPTGVRMLFDSGKFTTDVIAVDQERQRITVKFRNGGRLMSKKGINVPGVKLTTASPTDKDKEDAAFGREHKLPYVAISFAQTAEEVNNVRALLDPSQKVWAKVEEPVGVKNFKEIVEASDGIIVARGDLGVEVPLEEVPFIQQFMIDECHKAGKPVIVATQALLTMMNHPTPSRAEVSDATNSVLQGAGLWVSEETTIGKYPVEVVKMMVRIAERTEEYKKNHELKI